MQYNFNNQHILSEMMNVKYLPNANQYATDETTDHIDADMAGVVDVVVVAVGFIINSILRLIKAPLCFESFQTCVHHGNNQKHILYFTAIQPLAAGKQ